VRYSTAMDLLAEIRQYLMAARAWLRKVQDAIQQQSETQHDCDEVDRGERSPAQPLRAVVSFDDETVRATKAESERQHTTQEGIKKATWAAVMAASAYALITILIWCQTIRQTNVATAALRQSIGSFRTDERAWIEIQPINPILKSQASNGFGALFTYDIFPKNVGKTAAYDIAVKAIRGTPMSALSLGDKADEIASYQRMLLKNTFGMPEISISRRVPKTLGPGEVSNAPFDIYGQEPQKGLYQFLIGRVDYTDAFGVTHWMTFCFFIADSKGDLQYCQQGNDEDRSLEFPPN
jgi:hypothetical protein